MSKKSTVSFYAFEPGAPGVPPSSATGVWVRSVVRLLERHAEHLDAKTEWLRPAKPRRPGRYHERLAAARWFISEFRRLLAEKSRYIVFLYPKIPVVSHVNEPVLLTMAMRAYRLFTLVAKLKGQRIVLIMEDLPIEQAEGVAAAGGPAPALDIARVRAVEGTLMRAAHLIVTPPGYATLIKERYGVEEARFRSFHRNIYLLADQSGEPEPIDFQAGEVNFLYAGAIDPSIATNFREVLRSIQSTPRARLHVCGPGREAVEKWFEELGVTNAQHYGSLDVAAHDWLASRCDVGLVLWPVENPYLEYTPTSKYSSYVANGLAILSTDVRSVAENIRRDRVGLAMPIKELSIEIMRWATRPELFAEFKKNAARLEGLLRSGSELDPVLVEIAREP